MVKAKEIDLGLIPLESVWDDAVRDMGNFGKTDLYSTGDPVIDEYLGGSTTGGYGRPNGYEIITIFGDTGRNKSTFATNLVVDPLKKGKTVVYRALEDDPKDVAARLNVMGVDPHKLPGKLAFFKEQSGYTLGEMAKTIEKYFEFADVILIDPLQFIYEASVTERGEAEFNRQRLFMRQMNHIMKKTNKVLIIVSHTNKSGGKDAPGMSHIIGSSAIAQVSTKVIEIGIDKNMIRFIRMWKSRFTPHRNCELALRMTNMKFSALYGDDPNVIKKLREVWNPNQK